MPNRNGKRKVVLDGGRKCSRVACCFCEKILSKKEEKLHIYVCEKVPQEIFNQPNTPLGGSSVSFGTTSNSSLTNPLLGAPSLK